MMLGRSRATVPPDHLLDRRNRGCLNAMEQFLSRAHDGIPGVPFGQRLRCEIAPRTQLMDHVVHRTGEPT